MGKVTARCHVTRKRGEDAEREIAGRDTCQEEKNVRWIIDRSYAIWSVLLSGLRLIDYYSGLLLAAGCCSYCGYSSHADEANQ